MIRSKILQLTVATALIAGAQSALACSLAAWTGGPTGAVATGEPTTAGFARYSGRCSLRATATGQFVTDNSPNAEVTYKARFYAATGGITGEADFFQAQNTGGTNIIRVTYDGAQFKFYVNGTANTAVVPAVANKYYGIEVRWAAAGTFTAIVKGAGAATATTVSISGFTGGVVDTARLGWIAGGTLPGGANAPNFDEFDSRRSSDVGFLCPGNAVNTDTIISVADRNAITANILGTSLAIGQPDLNEDQIVSVADRNGITAIILAGTGGTICNGAN